IIGDQRRVYLFCHTSISLKYICYARSGKLLISTVKEKRMFQLVVFIQMVFIHVPLQYNKLFLHERNDTGFSSFSEEPDCVRFAFGFYRFWCQVDNFLHSCTGIVHESQKRKIPAPIPGCNIRLIQKQFYPFCCKIVDAFLLILHSFYRKYPLPFIKMMDFFVSEVRHKGVDGSQSVVSCCYSAVSFFLNPGKKINYPLSGKGIQSELF